MFLVPNRKKVHTLDAFDKFFEDTDNWFSDRNSLVSTPVSIRTDEKSITIESELPGIAKEDIKVEYDNGIVTINGVKKLKSDVKKEDYHYSERSFGSVSRSVRVGSDIDFDKASASFEDGVLHITIPKESVEKRKTLTL